MKQPRHAHQGLALFLAVLLLALAGCVPPAQDAPAKQLLAAINNRQPDAALGLFNSDAMVTIDGSAPYTTLREIQAWLESLTADHAQLAEVEILEQDGDSYKARYSLTTDRIAGLGLTALAGIGEIQTRQGRISTLSFNLSETSRADLLKAELHHSLYTTALSYAVLTNPDPLRASWGGEYEPNKADLTVVITNNTGEVVKTRSIKICIPYGQNATDLTPNTTGINPSAPEGWRIMGSDKANPLTVADGCFILQPELPVDGELDPGEGYFITLPEIQINDRPGVWGLRIDEETGEDTQGSLTIQLAKSPPALEVSDLTADALVIGPGKSVTLTWEGGDGATYSLFDGQAFQEVDHTGSYTVNITQTTTFYLTATLVGGEYLTPVIRERTVTVK